MIDKGTTFIQNKVVSNVNLYIVNQVDPLFLVLDDFLHARGKISQT